MIKTTSFLFFIFLFFAGCVNVTKELPSYTTYKLNVNQHQNKAIKTNKTIKVFEPTALSSINNTALGYFLNNHQFESYALSKLSDKPSKMLQYLIVEYLNATHNYNYVTSSQLSLLTDYKLYSHLHSFHQVINSEGSYVKLKISVFLKNHSSEVFYKTFTYDLPTKTDDAKGAVEALNDLSNSFVKDLDIWLVDNLK